MKSVADYTLLPPVTSAAFADAANAIVTARLSGHQNVYADPDWFVEERYTHLLGLVTRAAKGQGRRFGNRRIAAITSQILQRHRRYLDAAEAER